MSKLRSILYLAAKMLGDVSAIKRGKVVERVERRVAGRITGRILRGIFR